MSEPATLIENNGYVYKLLNSKEEQEKIDKRKAEDQMKSFGAFKQKIGTPAYGYLHKKGVTLDYSTGGNYSRTYYFDFADNQTWSTDEYSTSDKEHFGDANWYNYDKTDFASNFVSEAIHKMLQDYFFAEATESDK